MMIIKNRSILRADVTNADIYKIRVIIRLSCASCKHETRQRAVNEDVMPFCGIQ